jgi:hypothetical protein
LRRVFSRLLEGLMKRSTLFAAVAAGSLTLGVAVRPASATLYTDATGENHDGNAHMDFEAVTVTNDATNLHFSLDLRRPRSPPPTTGASTYAPAST